LQANINGFTITDRTGTPWGNGTIALNATAGHNLNLAEQKKTKAAGTANTTVKDFIPGADGKYRGILIYDNKQPAAAAGNTTDGTHIFGKSFVKSNKNGKDEIDALRNIKTRAEAQTASDDENNTSGKKAIFANFGDETKSDSKDFWGFEPGDITGDNGSGYNGGAAHNITIWKHMITKREIDIANAADKNAITKAAFLDPDFQEVNYNYILKANMATPGENSPTEVCSNALDLLDRHYNWLKTVGAVWKHDATKTTADPDLSDTPTKELVEEYEEMKKIVRIILVESYNADGSDKQKATSDKAILDALTNPVAGSVQERLSGAKLLTSRFISSKITELMNAINATLPPNNKNFDKDDELKTAIDGAKDDAKEVYEAFKALGDNDANKNNAFWGVLKGLVDKLGKVNDIDKPKAELEDAYSKKGGDTNDKKAWDFVNDKAKDSNSKGWADRVLATAKKNLTDAITSAKTEMSGEGDAEAKTEIKDVASIKEAKAIAELFKLCKEAHAGNSSDVDVLRGKIEKFRDTPGEKKSGLG